MKEADHEKGQHDLLDRFGVVPGGGFVSLRRSETNRRANVGSYRSADNCAYRRTHKRAYGSSHRSADNCAYRRTHKRAYGSSHHACGDL